MNRFGSLGTGSTAPWRGLAGLLFGIPFSATAFANPLHNPPTFASDPKTHVLDLLMVAKSKPLALPFALRTTGWAYEVCPRPATSKKPNECPAGTSVQPLGGVRFALQKGDTLKLRLVNQLPVITDSKHCSEPGHADLVNNPTNLHTHGLIVEPHRAEGPRDAYGDYVFLEIKNPANHGVCKKPADSGKYSPKTSAGLPFKICSASAPSGLGVPGALHPDHDVLDGAAEYSIHLPGTHPSGLFWFHPHLHGIAMNQISSGLSGVITVGKLSDICTDSACRAEVAAGSEQFLTLKDAQVEADGTLDDQQDPTFCGGSDGGHGGLANNGACSGTGPHSGGHWFHSVNGEVYPTITVGSHGSVWRMLNSSPSRDYDIQLLSESGAKIPMQVLAVDGVTIESSASAAALQQALGGKATTIRCPGRPKDVCVANFEMMPSSRIELRVINPLTRAQQANLQTSEYQTGPSGDLWPNINLANVLLDAPSPASQTHLDVGGAQALLSEAGVLGQPATIEMPGTDLMVAPAVKRAAAMSAPTNGPVIEDGLRQTPVFAIDPALQSGIRKDPACAALPKGHRRRIYFGYPTDTSFGLGYVEVDQNGKDVPGTFKSIRPFDPTKTTVCVPLEAGNRPTSEVWELVNLTAEDHNFHIHQTKFTLLSNDQVSGGAGSLKEIYVLHDNVPLPHANSACDGTLRTSDDGKCHPRKILVRIPFSQIGDFVYHCHIMEHEDGGMMARIRVVPGPDM